MDSLAVLERGYLFPSPGSIAGVKSECPFCVARHISEYQVSAPALMLQARDAGRLLQYNSSRSDNLVDQFQWVEDIGSARYMRLAREHWLTLPLEFLTVPFWLPGLSLRHSFVIDEVCVWLCSESAAGSRFHWLDERMIEIVRTCWRRRLPLRPAELSKVLLAHGMPESYQRRAEELFDFGMKTLIAAEGRKPLKMLRDEKPAQSQLFDVWTSLAVDQK